MRTRIFPLFALTTGLSLLLLVVLVVSQAGPSHASSQLPQAALPASLDRPDGPIQVFSTTRDLEPLAVEIVAPYLPSGLGVGGSVDLMAHAAPPLAATGGALTWSILSGNGGLEPLGMDAVILTLFHPDSISHDHSGVVVQVVYAAEGHVATDTLPIPLDPINFARPYIADYTFDLGGKPFPEPGDLVAISLEHALPPGYELVGETIEPPTLFTITEGFVPVNLQAWAQYRGPGGEIINDHLEDELALAFSYDLDGNGQPDVADLEVAEMLSATYSLSVSPLANDPWRGPEAMVAQMIIFPLWPFPKITYDPNCKPNVYGYYQYNGSTVNDIQFCPKASVTKLQKAVTFYHELKHWWDEKVTGKDQGEKAVEQFGWRQASKLGIPWTWTDLMIYIRMDPPIDPPLTFNTLRGSHVTWMLTLSNDNTAFSLDGVQLRLQSLMSSGGHYATGDTLGGALTVGANGLVETPATADDVQIISVGQGRPNAIIIKPGANGLLDTLPAGDDTLFPSEEQITSGAKGIVETVAQGDDVQVISLGQGYTSATFMPLGVGAGSDGTLNTAPLGDDQVLPPPALPIANLQIIPPATIPPGSQAVALISFDLIDDLTGPKGGAGVVQLVFELTAIQAGGVRRESIEVFLFLPPRLFLPIVLKNY